MQKYNFGAGPSILPTEVFRDAAEAVINLNNSGLSVLEISHRSKDFENVIEEAQTLIKELLKLNEDYSVLFLQGGASLQFDMIPYNLLDDGATAAYLETGVWAKRAIKEAKIFGHVNIVASSADKNFNYIPKNYTIPKEATYFHITTNNTIYGTQMHEMPKSPVSYIADMSSDIFSRELDANQFDLIYAGAQKNIGPSGATLVVIKKAILGKVKRNIPTMLDYKIHIENNSLYNTPSVFSIYVCLLTLRWIKKMGGLSEIEKRNNEKAALLYKEIDSNPLFEGTTAIEDRSKMNVTFVMTQPNFEDEFMKAVKDAGIIGIKGHRSVGGFRASLYNALPIESVKVLTDVMKDFSNKKS